MKCKNSNLYANGHSIFQFVTNFWRSNYRAIRFVNKIAEKKRMQYSNCVDYLKNKNSLRVSPSDTPLVSK